MIDATGGPHRLLTTSLDLNCSPYPEIREPAWDGDSLLFVVEAGGNNHLYRVRADGSAAPEVREAVRQVTLEGALVVENAVLRAVERLRLKQLAESARRLRS